METQTTILNLVTSAKNQEKTQEKLQKLNVPQQRQENLQSQRIQQYFHANTTLVKMNHNLSMNFLKQTFEHKIAKNLTPTVH